MKDLKIGKLIFKKKAIFLLAFCMFLNGTIIGAMAFLGGNINFIFFFLIMFLPYILLRREIRKNIIEIK